jgi:hypothetical protein
MESKMNAKDEFLKHTENKKVKCAFICYGEDYYEEEQRKYFLKVGFTNLDFDNFINSLNFMYDSGYGGQNLFGTIWYDDGTWSSRGEYDGSEWWEYNLLPEIPEDLKG